MADNTMQLVLIRHGESEWNKLNLFTGWMDVDLTDTGRKEAAQGGRALSEAGFDFDICYTSYLKRAIHTLNLVLESMDREWLPVIKSWRLNERHYGALQGLNKAETAAKYGDDQVLIWRRAYAIPPNPLSPDDERWAGRDPRYASLKPEEIPATECLKDTVARVIPYWKEEIEPTIRAGKRVLIAAHGNSLRALIKYIDDISDEDIVHLNIPTARPIVYEFDDDMKPLRHYYLGNQEEIQAAMAAVAAQGKAKK